MEPFPLWAPVGAHPCVFRGGPPTPLWPAAVAQGRLDPESSADRLAKCPEAFEGADIGKLGDFPEVALEVCGLVCELVAWDADVGADPTDSGVQVLSFSQLPGYVDFYAGSRWLAARQALLGDSDSWETLDPPRYDEDDKEREHNLVEEFFDYIFAHFH